MVGLFAMLTVLAADDPVALQVRVLEGEGAVYRVGGRATRGITIEVNDETNRPVDGATVTFHLPENGPSGTFATGARTEVVTTKPDGRAGVWGMQWNRTPGSFEVRITAIKGRTRAGIVVPQELDGAMAAVPAARSRARSGHKLLWITLAVAGTAAGSAAAVAFGRPGASAATAAPEAVKIGPPTITLGHP